MKTKLIKYTFTGLIIGFGLWFYFQLSTFPYRVDRWFQPLEAEISTIFAKKCAPSDSWLSLAAEHAVTQHGGYSIQVAHTSAEKQVHTCELGYKNKILGIPVNTSHRYRYASVTKLITAASIYSLIDQGRLDLNDKLLGFFPGLGQLKDPRIAEITLEHLLNHSAGFNRLSPNGDPMFLRKAKPWCPNDLTQLQSLSLAFNPGQKQVYSNLGYCLLGVIIQRVTGESFRHYAESNFSISARDIRFIENYYTDDEVRYDFRYEDWYNNSYLKLFDFDAISSVAGLSGSAAALAELLWDVQHKHRLEPLSFNGVATSCMFKKVYSCFHRGIYIYQPEKHGLALRFHDGYLPGVSSIAVIDSFGGVTVILKSGASIRQANPENEWVRWLYNRLSLHYTLQGKLPLLGFGLLE